VVAPGQVAVVDVHDSTLLTRKTDAMVTLAAPNGQGRVWQGNKPVHSFCTQYNTAKVATLRRGHGEAEQSSHQARR